MLNYIFIILLYCVMVHTKFKYNYLLFEPFLYLSSTARLLYSSKIKINCSQKLISELLLSVILFMLYTVIDNELAKIIPES